MPITATAKKKILKEVIGTIGAIPHDHVQRMSSRYQIPIAEIRDLLHANAYHCAEAPVAVRPAPPPPKPIKPKCPLTKQEVALVRSAKMYRSLGADPYGTIICTNGRLFHKERKAIIRLLEAFSDPED